MKGKGIKREKLKGVPERLSEALICTAKTPARAVASFMGLE